MTETTTSDSAAFSQLQGQLLIAMPSLLDPSFAQAVVYICEHTPEGAMGVVINRPLDISMTQFFEQFSLPCPVKFASQALLLGGPVQHSRGFILHRKTQQQWQATTVVDEQICLSASQDIIEAIAADEGPESSLIMLGYAGWGAGQLEQELLDNAWLTAPTDSDFLFNTPHDNCANLAAARINVDLKQLSNSVGHA